MNPAPEEIIEARRRLCRVCRYAIPWPGLPGKFMNCQVTGRRLAWMTNKAENSCPKGHWGTCTPLRILAQPANPKPRKIGVGDVLHEMFVRYFGAAPCSACSDEICRINKMSYTEIELDRENIVNRIMSRSSLLPAKWQQLVAAKTPRFAAFILRRMISRAVNTHRRQANASIQD